MKIYLLLAEDPFYTLPLVKSIVEDTEHYIVGATFPSGFINIKRIQSTLLIYGAFRFIKTVFFVLYWKAINGGRVAHYLQSKGIDIRYEKNINSSNHIGYLNKLEIDLLVSNNCPQKLNNQLLLAPNKGAINLHLGMLPYYRGVYPIFHALINNEKEIGITVHYMDDKYDNGGIIIQKNISITEKEDLFKIYPRAFKVGAELLNSSIELINKGEAIAKANGPNGASYFSYPTFKDIVKFRIKFS